MGAKRYSTEQILDKLGAGGMGEVYRAEDTTLGREVAIKVLPAGFTDDPERLARSSFSRHPLASPEQEPASPA